MEETEIVETEQMGTEPIVEREVVEQPKPQSFVKIREQKAVEKTTNSILNELGVRDLEEAKAKLARADEALSRINNLEQNLQRKEYESTYDSKVNQLTKLLEKENVFDAESLINYLDIDQVDIDRSGNIIDTENIIKQLKERKPNYFGRDIIATDTYSKGNSKIEKDPYKEDYENKNYKNVIATYLRNNRK